MKLQFGTTWLLLATAFIGISIGGNLPFWRALQPSEFYAVPYYLGVLSPIIVPCLFAAYALGRRALTPRIILAFAIGEAIAVITFWQIVP